MTAPVAPGAPAIHGAATKVGGKLSAGKAGAWIMAHKVPVIGGAAVGALAVYKKSKGASSAAATPATGTVADSTTPAGVDTSDSDAWNGLETQVENLQQAVSGLTTTPAVVPAPTATTSGVAAPTVTAATAAAPVVAAAAAPSAAPTIVVDPISNNGVVIGQSADSSGITYPGESTPVALPAGTTTVAAGQYIPGVSQAAGGGHWVNYGLPTAVWVPAEGTVAHQ